MMNFLEKKTPTITSIEIITMIFALVGTGLIMWNFFRISRVHDSLLIRSDALHYSSDIVMNSGILIALIITKYLGIWWIDAIFAIGIALWIVKNALPIIWSGISMLLDTALSHEEMAEIERIFQ
jgi:ferrous-iron efflux pump FieF